VTSIAHVCDGAYSCVRTQCVAVCCSVLQSLIMCCSVLQCVAVRCSALQCVAVRCNATQCTAVSDSAYACERDPLIWMRHVLQCVAACHGAYLRDEKIHSPS